MKIEKKEFEAHPEGWFLFKIMLCEPIESEFKGKTTKRFQWTCQSSEKKSSGEPFMMSVYTGRDLIDDERCKLKLLVEACGVDCDQLDDTEDLAGCVFAGKCKAGDGDKSGFVNIAAFDTKDRVRKSGEKPKTQKGEADPFEDE